ncbi:MAG: nucleotidyltransferase family protein [Candidatus Caldatribacteriaceae bacterium]
MLTSQPCQKVVFFLAGLYGTPLNTHLVSQGLQKADEEAMEGRRKKTLREIIELLRQHKEELETHFKVQEIGVFGSYVRGEAKRGSDLDILVTFKEPVGLFTFMDLEEYLEELTGVKVDLVSKKALKPGIGERILQEVMSI